jgi:uncharacterized protein YbgA (DUF1722 family)
MLVDALVGMLKEFGESQVPKNPYQTEDCTLSEDQIQQIKREKFEKSPVVIDNISFPVQIYVRDSHEEVHFCGATIHEIREDGNELLFRLTLANGNPAIVSEFNLFELYAGEFGRKYLMDAKFAEHWERGLVEFYNGSFGKFISRIEREEMRDEGTSLDKFVEPLRHMAVPELALLRHKLNVLLFLVRLDGRLCGKERDVIAEYIKQEAKGSVNISMAMLSYVEHSLITPEIFKISLDELARHGLVHLTPLLTKTEEIIMADGQLSPKEEEIFASMKKAG